MDARQAARLGLSQNGIIDLTKTNALTATGVLRRVDKSLQLNMFYVVITQLFFMQHTFFFFFCFN